MYHIDIEYLINDIYDLLYKNVSIMMILYDHMPYLYIDIRRYIYICTRNDICTYIHDISHALGGWIFNFEGSFLPQKRLWAEDGGSSDEKSFEYVSIHFEVVIWSQCASLLTNYGLPGHPTTVFGKDCEHTWELVKSAGQAKSCWTISGSHGFYSFLKLQFLGLITACFFFFKDEVFSGQNFPKHEMLQMVFKTLRSWRWCSPLYCSRTLKANLEMLGSSLCSEKQLWSPHTIRRPIESMQERLKRKQNFLKSLSGSLDGEAFKFRILTWLGISVCLMLSYLVQQLGHEICGSFLHQERWIFVVHHAGV